MTNLLNKLYNYARRKLGIVSPWDSVRNNYEVENELVREYMRTRYKEASKPVSEQSELYRVMSDLERRFGKIDKD